MQFIVALDPGSEKVGFAVVRFDLSPAEMGIVSLTDLPTTLTRLCTGARPEAVVLGNGTRARAVADALSPLLPTGIPVCFIDETNTTYEARARYFRDHPPTGWRRLLPLGMQIPPRPLDDYAAWLIGERYLKQGRPDTA